MDMLLFAARQKKSSMSELWDPSNFVFGSYKATTNCLETSTHWSSSSARRHGSSVFPCVLTVLKAAFFPMPKNEETVSHPVRACTGTHLAMPCTLKDLELQQCHELEWTGAGQKFLLSSQSPSSIH